MGICQWFCCGKQRIIFFIVYRGRICVVVICPPKGGINKKDYAVSPLEGGTYCSFALCNRQDVKFGFKKPARTAGSNYPTNFFHKDFFFCCFLIGLRWRGADVVTRRASRCCAFFFFASVDGSCAPNTSSAFTFSAATR